MINSNNPQSKSIKYSTLHEKQKIKNYVLFLLLVCMIFLFFGVSIVKMQTNL